MGLAAQLQEALAYRPIGLIDRPAKVIVADVVDGIKDLDHSVLGRVVVECRSMRSKLERVNKQLAGDDRKRMAWSLKGMDDKERTIKQLRRDFRTLRKSLERLKAEM